MQKTGINMERVKKENRSLILNYINDNGPVSRIDIAEATGLTAASVTQITTALISEGILCESGISSEKKSSAGRKKVLLAINADAAFVLSINIETETTTIAICNLLGEVLYVGTQRLFSCITTGKKGSPKRFLKKISDECVSLLLKLGKTKAKRIACTSIGIPGIVDNSLGIAVHAYGIWDEPVNLAEYFEDSLGYPVLVENNVDAFAIGEILFGHGRTQDSLLVIKWGPGVGSTIVIDKQVYKGRHGKTAELGHFIVERNGQKCTCGRSGCLETVVSQKALMSFMDFKPEKFGEAYEKANVTTKRKINSTIDLFARSIVNTCTIIAPNRIVLSGILFSSPLIREILIKYCKKYDPAYDGNRIIYTKLYEKEAYIGPVAVYLNTLLN